MTYNRASLGCLVHALTLSGGAWLVFAGDLAITDLTRGLLTAIWVVLLIAWPAWGFVLWKASERKVWRMLHTLIVGFLFLCPTFILPFVLHGLRHQTTW